MGLAQTVRILLVEDNLRDAQMVMEEVGRGEIAASFLHVKERRETLAALDEEEWGLIITDFSLPDMTAMELLDWMREQRLDVPVIVISTAIGEELAVMAMHAGAHDFITKESLARLNPAIERELQEVAIHRQRWLAEAALQESERNFRQLTEAIPEVFWLIDCEQQQMVYLSPSFEAVWEQPSLAIMEQPRKLLETIHPEDYDHICRKVDEFGWLGLNGEYRIVLPDGSVRWLKSRSFPVHDNDGRVFRMAGLTTDITERMRLEQEREMMSRALAQTADSVMITDARGIITYVNPAFEELTGYPSVEVIGKTAGVLKSGFQSDAFYRAMWSNISNGLPFTEVFLNRRKDGELYYEAKTITPIRDADGEVSHYVSTGKDITDSLKTKERLTKIANYDAVTGLANLLLLKERMERAALRFSRHQHSFGLLCLELDLEGLLGKRHDSRLLERLLHQVAQRLTACVDRQDTVARVDNDQFMILHKDHQHIHEDLERLAAALMRAFASPLVDEGYELFVTPSIGISIYKDEEQRVEHLLQHARLAMEHARSTEHGGYSFFNGGMEVRAKHLSS